MHERAVRRRAPEELDERGFRVEIEPGGPASDLAEAGLVFGAGERDRRGSGEQDDVAFPPGTGHFPDVLEQADATDDGRRVDRAPIRLVVERDVPGDDRDPQCLARLRHPLDRLDELPGDRALLRVAEVEAVGEAERLGAGAGDVPRRLEHCEPAAGARIEPPHPAGAVERDGEAAVAGPQAQHGRVEPGPADGAGADEVVVAAVDRRAAADVVAAEQLDERVLVRRRVERTLQQSVAWLLARLRLDAVARALVGEQSRRDLADDLIPPESAQKAGVGDLADDGRVQLPALADCEHVVEHLRADDRDHPLLALADHHLPRLHPLLAERHRVEAEVDPALPRHLGEGGGEAGGAAVLQRFDETGLDELDRDLDQLLAHERVADLDGGPLVGVVLAELLAREHRRAPDPVTPGRGPVEDDEVAGARGAGARDPVGRQKPDAHRVHEHVVAVGLVEEGLAADRRHADRVPVGADPGDGAVEAGVARREAEAVEQRDRARAHRDDVAQDPTDPGRGALERLDRGGVVVALDLEADGLAVAEVDHARILTGALQHAFPFRGKPFQQEGRMLVAAVLRPEQREDRQLEVVGLAPEQLDDAVQLPVREAERAMDGDSGGGLSGDLGQVIQCSWEGRRRRPRLERV